MKLKVIFHFLNQKHPLNLFLEHNKDHLSDVVFGLVVNNCCVLRLEKLSDQRPERVRAGILTL